MSNDELNQFLAEQIAKGLVETGAEGAYDSVSCSTAGDYPSLGCSQWEGGRGNALLSEIAGGEYFAHRTYSDLRESGDLPALQALLGSKEGIEAQMKVLQKDCLVYVDVLRQIPTLDDTRCLIYCGLWCPTSHYVVRNFLERRWERYDLRSLATLRDVFRDLYWIAADVGHAYRRGYANRAERCYQYVAAIDLTTKYGIPAYGEAGNGR